MSENQHSKLLRWKLPDLEPNQIKTHGEAVQAKKDSMQMIEGVFVVKDIKIPPRLDKPDATEYYNNKFYAYWLTQFDNSIPKGKRETILNFMLGRC